MTVVVILLLLLVRCIYALVREEDDSWDDVYMRDFWVTFGGICVIVITVLVIVAFYRVWRSTDVASTTPLMIRETIAPPPPKQVRFSPRTQIRYIESSSSSDDELSGR